MGFWGVPGDLGVFRRFPGGSREFREVPGGIRGILWGFAGSGFYRHPLSLHKTVISLDSLHCPEIEKKEPNSNYSCCVKSMLTLEQMPILLLSRVSLLGKKTQQFNLLRTMKYFDAAALIHAGAERTRKSISIGLKILHFTSDLGRS